MKSIQDEDSRLSSDLVVRTSISIRAVLCPRDTSFRVQTLYVAPPMASRRLLPGVEHPRSFMR